MLLGVAATANATLVYDIPTTALTFTGSTPRATLGDNFALPALNAGLTYRINSITFVLIQASSALKSITTNVKFFTGVDTAAVAPNPIFSSNVSNVTVGLGANTVTSTSAYLITLDYLANNLSFEVPGGSVLGVSLTAKESGQTNNALTFALADAGSTVAGSAWSNGYFRDANDNGIIDPGEGRNIGGWTNGNLVFSIDATVVPEPASLIALTLGTLAVIRRKRK